MRFLTLAFFLLTTPLFAQFKTNSVLASGNWVKLNIPETGVYAVTFQDLTDLGIDPSGIFPSQISVFGNGGAALPQKNGDFRYDDLVENAIEVTGAADGTFDTEDKIIFYAQGTAYWDYSNSDTNFTLTKNIYSDTSCYFLLLDNASPGLRVATQSKQVIPDVSVNRYTERIGMKPEVYNFLKSGRQWHGIALDSLNTFSFDLDNAVPDSEIKIEVGVLSRSTVSSGLTVSLNGVAVDQFNFSVFGMVYYTPKADFQLKEYTLPASGLNNGQLEIQLDYAYNAPMQPLTGRQGGFLDYLDIQYEKFLNYSGEQLPFRNTGLAGKAYTCRFFSNPGQEMRIWKVSDIFSPVSMHFSTEGDSVSFSDESEITEEYIAFSELSLKHPVIAPVQNQNLHAITKVPNLMIITHPAFKGSAESLADYRRSESNLTVEVVTTDQIYNEFSSGKKDISAIRDFTRMVYLRGNGNDSLKYLLLLGDASYDYKNLTAGGDFVPAYESLESINPLRSYVSDDFFGFLDAQEGEWAETGPNDHLLNIAIGRLPATTHEEAEAVVNKIKNYGKSIRADWNNRLTFIADDGDMQLHMDQSDQLTSKVESMDKPYLINKIYIDDYPQQDNISAPEAQKAVYHAFNTGALIVNYTGHGHAGWAQERVITYGIIDSLENGGKEPFVISAACTFNQYDDPDIKDCSERMLLKKEGGAIGTLAAARPVISSINLILNMNFIQFLLTNKEETIGEIFRKTKNNSLYAVGDPSLKLAFPEDSVVLTAVNGSSPVPGDTLQQNESITIKGTVTPVQQFKGYVKVLVFDKETSYATLGDENDPFTYLNRKNLIFRDSITVAGPDFTTSFKVPESVGDSIGSARIVFFAVDTVANITYHGVYSDIKAGGQPSVVLSLNKDLSGSINTYPNPFHSDITVDIPPSLIYDDLLIQVVSGTGVILDTYPVSYSQSASHIFNTESIPQGHFILNIRAYKGGKQVWEENKQIVK